MKNASNILEVDNLKVFFKSKNGFIRAVDDVSFNLKKNSKLGIIGESGSGKTVLLSSICGIVKGDPGIVEGKITFNGIELLDKLSNYVSVNENGDRITIKKNEYAYFKMLKHIKSMIKSEISMIFQDPRKSLDPLFTIEEQMMESFKLNKNGKQLKNESTNVIKELMADWLLKVNIDEPHKVLKQFPNELSGGMLQRVMIAITMIIEPSIIIADEPTTALDVNTTVKILDLLEEMFQSTNSSIIFVTHDIGLAERFSNETIVMNSGQFVEYGDNQSIFHNHYKHPYTNKLFKSRLKTLETDRFTPVFFMDDRLPDEIFFNTGCKFRKRCEFADESCSVMNKNIKISDNHWILCKKLYDIYYDE